MSIGKEYRTRMSVVAALKELDSDLFDRLHEQITEESLYRYLKPVADTHSPFQTATLTRSRVIEALLAEDGVLDIESVRYERNYRNTGNSVFLLGERESEKDVWLLAHLDQITYLVEAPADGAYPLTPICYHLMQDGRRNAVALAYNAEHKTYEIVARGQIVSEGGGEAISFMPDDPSVELHAGVRICFDSQLEWDPETGIVRGSLDDAAGAVALVMAGRFLADYDIEVLIGLTDEEEGKAGLGSQSICRGGARLLRFFEQPKLVVATDIHEAAEMYGGEGPENFQVGGGASFAEKASKGVGTISPPHLYELKRQMAYEFASQGIRLRENQGGYISRTESVNALLRTPNISLIGFLGVDRHFQRDVESASIRDLVDLSKTIAAYTLLTQTSLWQEWVVNP